MKKVAFVILHYRTFKDTLECVQSILSNVVYEHYYIVIVDNGSDNNSGDLLLEKYHGQSNIKIIRNEKNLGFSDGNNVGYRYARNKLNAEFILMINNDTIIDQPTFIDKIVRKFEDFKYHLLGPDILAGPERIHQNPRFETLNDSQTLRRFLSLYRRLLLLSFFRLDLIAERVKKAFIPASRLPSSIKPNLNPGNQEMHDVKLHGSAIVFSPLFIEKYDHGFYPGTFMYSEESILYYIVRKDGLKTIYFPEVKIFHKEDSATNTMFVRSVQKRRFYYRNFIKSGKILLSLMEKSN